MPWAVSCCPFGASLGANLLNAALLLYTPKALPAPQALYPAEGLYPQLCCFTRTAGALHGRRLYPHRRCFTRPKAFTRSSAALHAEGFTRTAGALHGGTAALLIELPRRPVLGVLHLKAEGCQLVTNLIAGGPVLIGLCLGTQVEHHVYHLAEGLLTGGVTAS